MPNASPIKNLPQLGLSPLPPMKPVQSRRVPRRFCDILSLTVASCVCSLVS